MERNSITVTPELKELMTQIILDTLVVWNMDRSECDLHFDDVNVMRVTASDVPVTLHQMEDSLMGAICMASTVENLRMDTIVELICELLAEQAFVIGISQTNSPESEWNMWYPALKQHFLDLIPERGEQIVDELIILNGEPIWSRTQRDLAPIFNVLSRVRYEWPQESKIMRMIIASSMNSIDEMIERVIDGIENEDVGRALFSVQRTARRVVKTLHLHGGTPLPTVVRVIDGYMWYKPFISPIVSTCFSCADYMRVIGCHLATLVPGNEYTSLVEIAINALVHDYTSMSSTEFFSDPAKIDPCDSYLREFIAQ